MRNRRGFLISTSVLAVMIGIIFLAGKPQPSSGQITGREGPCGCYTCYWQLVPTLYVYFPDPPKNCYGIISSDACAIEMAKMPDKGKAFCQKIKKELGITSFKNCPEYAAACADDCEKYTGEIACDCNGDGTDDTTKTFESCGAESSFPRQFKSRCEQWATGDGGFSFSTDIGIQRLGQEWLKSLSCPSLNCHQKYATCTGPLETNLQKCLTGNRLIGSRRRCQQYYTNAKTKCEKARTLCLNGLRRHGPAPVPQPLPTPTPSLGFFKPMSLGGPLHPGISGNDVSNCRPITMLGRLSN